MAELLTDRPAPGAPGVAPRWTSSRKDGVGTAYSEASTVWYTVREGVVEEVYYPTIDRPQIRDLQLLFRLGGKAYDERQDFEHAHELLAGDALGFRITNTAKDRRFAVTKTVIAAQTAAAVVVRTVVTPLGATPEELKGLRAYVLLAPHVDSAGGDNTAQVARTVHGDVLVAHGGSARLWVALKASVPFVEGGCSCGFVGQSDGWSYVHRDGGEVPEHHCAEHGNVAATGELSTPGARDFTLALAFGSSLNEALTTLFQVVAIPFDEHLRRFLEGWALASRDMARPPAGQPRRKLFSVCRNLLLAHEDKTYDGALVASASIPWGGSKDDLVDGGKRGGYHLVWPRDACHSASALLASGDRDTPLRTLIYLACTQLSDGGIYQNFWLDGDPYFHSVQLDEIAFPIMLAYRLAEARALAGYDPTPFVLRAAGAIMWKGPSTVEDRWEENSGYSPSTLAAVIAGLVCAARFASGADKAFILDYADFLEANLEYWTVTRKGKYDANHRGYYVRIMPTRDGGSGHGAESPDEFLEETKVTISNREPSVSLPAAEVVDAGFLELVRYGIRSADDPIIVNSVEVVDAVLGHQAPLAYAWHRYNEDGYGQKENGGDWDGTGRGGPWPILTGERGHYELAAGRTAVPYLDALEAVASGTGLLPEQLWDGDDLPAAGMIKGKASGAAMPLAWAHAEYMKLVLSDEGQKVVDLVPEVADRYIHHRPGTPPPEIWTFDRKHRTVHARAGGVLRIIAKDPFTVRYSFDGWASRRDADGVPRPALGVHATDLRLPATPGDVAFTFYWPRSDRWEQDEPFRVRIR